MTKKRILGTGNFALDIIFQREYPEGYDTDKKRNPFVDKKIIEEVGEHLRQCDVHAALSGCGDLSHRSFR